MVGFELGVGLPSHGSHASREAVLRVASAAEELGFDSVWATEHLLVAPEAADPWGEVLDPLSSLAYIGARYERIGLGTSCLVLPLHHPVHVAKRAATVQLLCGDRLRLGIGVGWHEPEFEFLGLGFADRGRRSDEAIRLMRALWRGEPGFEGRYWSFSDTRFGPLPGAEPQLWIGGLSQCSLRRAREHGATWHPESADPQLVRRAKRGWADGRVAARLRVPFGDSDAYLAGPPERVASRLEALIEAGLDGAVLGFGSEPAEIIAGMRRFSDEVWPRVAQRTSAAAR